MIKDYTAYQLTSHLSEIQALIAAEAKYEAARQAHDREARPRAKRELDRLRQTLAAGIPAAAFHYLAGC
jgi:hypothetical protein